MNATDFEFIPPPEAPVFEPTAEEFKDPLAYIAKIRPIAEQTGICKIKPPPEWQPPFAVDVDNFRFTPRMQRLNELEATTRVKLNFLDQIAKFWELQGSSLKIPNVERKALDLFTLYRVVLEEGGSEVVSRERRWARIATRMGYPPGRGVGTLLRQHYERILYPYHVFQEGTSIEKLTNLQDGDSEDSEDKDYVPHGIPSRQAIRPPEDRYARRSKRRKDDPDDIDYSTNSELKKLQFYGAGPKMPGFHGQGGGVGGEEECKAEEAMLKENHIECFKDLKMGLGAKDLQMGFGTKLSGSFLKETRSVGVAAKLGFLLKRKDRPRGKMPIDQIVCTICSRGDEEASMLLCDGCDDSYHTFCLIPPLPEIPKGDWRCPCCVAKEVNKPQEAFGFEQAQREYTLQEFGQKADEFKTNYFNMPVHRVPFSMVEKEFWRIVNAVDEDVTVEYGADLHTIEHGSGFPNSKTKSLMPGDDDYIQSGWNLNNLPVLEGSVLKHIQADISGMKIPWTYVGMCFATFCWHNEDHWSYSINYLHWGEPKTWYGVPGGKAEAFEEAMRSVAPELFSTQPDLLHQLVTIMNPNLLISHGVPICRTNQQAGEFVVTFPRSYHAGFNQGYNFAEAVNFAPADWLPIGRVCVAHYGMLHRFCVFSHDELVCKMASDPERLDVSIAASTYQDMLRMVEDERELRKTLKDWGVTQASREVFELVPDDERQCDYCKTTCFLSAVTCSCTNSNKVTCIHHKDKLCSCPPEKHCLLYRYTLDELPSMLHRLKVRAESFDNWSARVEEALGAPANTKLSLCELKELAQQAEEKHFPHSDLLQALGAVVEEAEKCTALAQQLLSRRVRTRTRQSGETKSPARLTLEDLLLFHQQLSTLACEIKESFLVKDLLDRAIAFQTEAREILKDTQADSKKLEKCLEVGINLDIEFPEIPQLKQKVQQSRWVEEVGASLGCGEVSLESLRRLLERGASIAPHPSVERVLAELQDLLTFGETWEEKAKACLAARPKLAVHALEGILQKAGTIDVHMPNVLQLKDAVCKAKDWLAKVQLIQKGPHNPYLEAAEWLVGRGRGIPVRLEPLPALEQQVETARAWRDKTSRTFLKKNSPHSLLEVLSPRKDIGAPLPTKKSKKRKEPDNDADDSFPGDMKLEETKDPAAIVSMFKEAEKAEVEAMVALRARNEHKHLEEEARFCVCGKPSAPNMLSCDLCKDCFHAGCVPVGRRQEGRFLCPLCVRSRRPRLETILSLLLALQKLPLRLPEGEALQCLTERAMNWQDRAKQMLKTEEVCGALASLSADHPLKAEDQKWVPPSDAVPAGTIQEVNMDTSENDSSANYSMEHAYSNASKTGTGGVSGVGASLPRKHARKSPLVARQMHPPALQLGEGLRLRLERLAVEGELLEMTLDESQDLWRLLRATSLAKDSADMHEVDHSSIQVEKKKPKKQKLDHLGKSSLMKKFSKGKVSKAEGKGKKMKSFRFKKEMRDGTVKTVKMKAFERKKKKSEPDEVCSAASCLRPFGGAVNWVQCDGGCEQWFHLLCVGLDVSQVSEAEDYICPNCRRDSVAAASVLASFSSVQS